MRRVLRTLLALLGLAALLAGAGTAAYVGSDDTVVTPRQSFGVGTTPVVTEPRLLAWQGLTITLRAQAEGGVFVGTGHPVDVADLLQGTAQVRLVGLSPEGLTADNVGGRAPDVRLDAVDVWDQAMSGTGVQELTIDDDSVARQWVVAPLAQGPVTLQVGITQPGTFRLAVGVALAGLLLLVVAVELSLGAGRRRRREAALTEQPARARGGRRRRAGAARVAVPLAGVLVLTGCRVDLPVTRAPEASLQTKVALTDAEARAALASYDKRNNAAIKAAGAPRYDASRWPRADRGVALEGDRFATRMARVTKASGPTTRVHDPVAVYAARFGSYPMWALVAARTDRDSDHPVEVLWLTRAGVTAPWLARATAWTEGGVLPDAADAQSLPRRRVVRRALDARTAWRVSVQRGKADGIVLDSGTKRWRRSVTDLVDRPIFTSSKVQTATAGGKTAPVVAVDGGYLTMVSIRVTTTLRGRAGLAVHWDAPYGQVRRARDGRLSYAHLGTAVVLLPDDGEPRVLGATFREVQAPPLKR